MALHHSYGICAEELDKCNKIICQWFWVLNLYFTFINTTWYYTKHLKIPRIKVKYRESLVYLPYHSWYFHVLKVKQRLSIRCTQKHLLKWICRVLLKKFHIQFIFHQHKWCTIIYKVLRVYAFCGLFFVIDLSFILHNINEEKPTTLKLV